MCRPVTCATCGKTTWAGCGKHVDDVMRDVPKERRCTCDTNASTGAAGESKGFLARMLGR